MLVKKGGRGRRRGREVENGVAVIGRFLKRRERKDRIRFPCRGLSESVRVCEADKEGTKYKVRE